MRKLAHLWHRGADRRRGCTQQRWSLAAFSPLTGSSAWPLVFGDSAMPSAQADRPPFPMRTS